MTSKIIVNNIESDTGVSTVTISSPVNLSGGITGSGFSVGTGTSISSPSANTLRINAGIANSDATTIGGGNFLYGTTSNAVYDTNGGVNVGDYWSVQFTSPSRGKSGVKTLVGVAGTECIIGFANTNTSGNSIISSLIQSTLVSDTAGSETGKFSIYTKPSDNRTLERFIIDPQGRVTKPYQPFFYATAGAQRDNQTSNPTVFSNVITNVGNHYDGTTNYRFTAPVAGVYLFTSQPGYKETGDNASWKLYKNGVAFTDFLRILDGLNSHSSWSCAALVYLGVGDYVYIGWDGAAGGYHQNASMSYFSGTLIG